MMDLSRFIYPLSGGGRQVPSHTKLLTRPARSANAVVGLTVTPVRYRVIEVVKRRKRANTRPPLPTVKR